MTHFWTPPSISSFVEKPFGNFDCASSALAFGRLYSSTGVLGSVILKAGREERASGLPPSRSWRRGRVPAC